MAGLKSVEVWFRSIAPMALLYAFGGPRREAIPDWRARPYRVAFLRDDGIGDLIVSMETLRAIKDASPTITLDLIASPQNAAFARTLPFIDEVMVHRRGSYRSELPTWRRLRANRYDAIIDGRAAVGLVNTHTMALLLASGARWRIGVSGRRNDSVYTVPVDAGAPTSFVEMMAALATPFGVRLAQRDWRPRLTLSADERAAADALWSGIGAGRPRVLVNISVGNEERVWRLDRYGPVIARVRERMPRAAILVVAMPRDQDVAGRLAAAAGGSARDLSFAQVTAAVATADLVMTPDTSIGHVASAFQIPTLALMRKDTAAWAPYRTPGRAVFGDVKKQLEPGLPTERVVAALDLTIDELGRSRGWV
ncbi:MAG TPA: glycosyltransferase family 9 protein [Gemmatimonadaceae bacterium]|nr:glycosyltransferase family 9 protein [Gemmatimonadaceae bacterium]